MRALLPMLISTAMLFVARGQELFQGAGDVNPSEVDRVYVKGLQYLAKAQMPEGRWNEMPYGAEPAVVALAVVAMLARITTSRLTNASGRIMPSVEARNRVPRRGRARW